MNEGRAGRTAATALVDALVLQGTERVFCVPGESFLGVLDALYERRAAIATIACRQEGGAAYMAEAHGKLTNRPGIAFASRGPGACNAAIGVHAARQDSTPMILFVGQVGLAQAGREAFQEVDVGTTFAGLAKATLRLDDPDRTPETVARAFTLAMTGRPGPVVVALPEDVLSRPCTAPDIPPGHCAEPGPDDAAMAALGQRLRSAARPLLIAGGSLWTAEARGDLEALAARLCLPVATAFRRADHIDNDHLCYAGDLGLGANPDLAAMVRESDCLIALGARLDEPTTAGYTRPAAPHPARSLIHIHPDPGEPGRVFRTDLAITASGPRAAAAMRAALESGPWADMQPFAEAWRARGRSAYEAWQRPRPCPGPVQLAEIVAWLRERLPAHSIVTNGAGNYAGWISRYYRFRRFRSQLAPTVGAMGYGVPAAIAAKLACPDRPVLSVNGDGCFLMNGQELATAVAHRLAIVFLVINNGLYGTIRMHQEKTFPGRPIATDIAGPDFAALARAYGAQGETVVDTASFAPACERALAAGGPALIDLRLDPDAISTTASLADLGGRPVP
ncbi:MAG: thiamine pyrophosphate-binding protein [Alphaproteobacteria bacterium]|jgi:acetolactate synthase-1/2/3 large subunit|nr:thiamine pyrophosphate-binding protein [Alphaproteobacteria bacterium]